jgi:hypothetical protein
MSVTVQDMASKRHKLMGSVFVVQVNTIAWVHFNFEGIMGNFVESEWAGTTEKLKGYVKWLVQMYFWAECMEWEKAYGCAE